MLRRFSFFILIAAAAIFFLSSCSLPGYPNFKLRDNWSELYVVDADGSNPTRLGVTFPSHGIVLPEARSRVRFFPSWSWSPDNSRIAFLGAQQESVTELEIGIIDVDGMNRRSLTKGVSAPDSNTIIVPTVLPSGPGWSRDGKEVAFGSKQGYMAVNADGSGLRRVGYFGGEFYFLGSSTLAGEGSAVLSPDGTKIAFVKDEGWRSGLNIWVANADGSNPRRITGSQTHEYLPVWSWDSKKISFLVSWHADFWQNPL